MGQNKENMPARVLSTLQADLSAAGKDSDRLIDTIEKLGEHVEKRLLPEASKRQEVPNEIKKILLLIQYENSKRSICEEALHSIERAIEYFQDEIDSAVIFYENELKKLKDR